MGRPQSKGDKRKLTRNERISQLTAKLRERDTELATLRRNSEAELARLRPIAAEREARQSKMPERIAQAVAEGRRQFADFDDVIRGVQLDAQAFEALLSSTNGPYLMYTAGLGMRTIRAIQTMRQLQAEKEQIEQAERERIEHYRKLHRQHFGARVQ